MKRRLTRAYDAMTMPDRCSNTIERKLSAQLESRKSEIYIKTMAPEPVRRRSWKGVTAVLCLTVVCLSAMALFLNRPASVQTVEPTAANSTATETDLQPQNKEVPMEFAEVLSGGTAYFYGDEAPMTLEEYCAGLWGEVTVKRYAVVDMDQDGICELVVLIQTVEAEAHLVLRQDGKYVCGYPFQPGELMDLKKDGSFFRRDRDHRLYFNDEESWYTTEVQEQAEKPLAQWHAYPCVRPDMVLQSYEYAGTGQSRMPSTTYYTFEGLVMGTTANDWSQLKEDLPRMGMVCLEDEGTVSVFDPDAPGTCLYGTLTNEKGLVQLADVVYYISNEYGEREAEVRDLLSEDPQYIAGSHLEEVDSHGREVERLKALLEYLS